MAGGVADAEQNRHVAPPRFGEGVVAPGPPVDRIVLVERRLYRAAASDLPGLRSDGRLQLGGLSRDSGLASGDIVEAYVHDDVLNSVVDDYLLSPAASGGNVVLHVVPAGQAIYPESLLLLAADLVEHHGPREEKRALELIGQAHCKERPR